MHILHPFFFASILKYRVENVVIFSLFLFSMTKFEQRVGQEKKLTCLVFGMIDLIMPGALATSARMADCCWLVAIKRWKLFMIFFCCTCVSFHFFLNVAVSSVSSSLGVIAATSTKNGTLFCWKLGEKIFFYFFFFFESQCMWKCENYLSSGTRRTSLCFFLSSLPGCHSRCQYRLTPLLPFLVLVVVSDGLEVLRWWPL